jgi:DNA-directed RNA polymerase subunit E'/Rpb7
MFSTIYLDERVAVLPAELNNIRTEDGIKDILLMKLRERHEGKCNANGYVKPNSIELIARSMGQSENGRFTGNPIYDCKIKCEVLFPVAGTIMEGIVLKIVKMGAYVVNEEAIRILLPRDIHLNDPNFDNIQQGQTVKVRIERSRFQANDLFIMAIGRLVTDSESAE